MAYSEPSFGLTADVRLALLCIRGAETAPTHWAFRNFMAYVPDTHDGMILPF